MNWRQLLQQLRRSRHYYLTVIGSLSLLLAMVFLVFSLMSVVFWSPLPYRDSNQLQWLEGTLQYQGNTSVGTNHRNLAFVSSHVRSIKGMAAYYSWSDYKLTMLPARPAVPVLLASHNLFEVLGTEAYLGRLFSPLEAEGNRQPSAILSYEVWQQLFQADPTIVGQKIQLNQRSFTVIGVTQPELVLPQNQDAARAIWLPFDMDEQLDPKTFGGYAGALKAVVRLGPSQSIAAVTEEISAAMAQAASLHTPELAKEYPVAARLTDFEQAIRGESGAVVLMLLIGVALLTLIGLVNLSSLQLARAVARHQQMAICAAFGASRWQLLLDVLRHNTATVAVATGLALLLTASSFGVVAQIAGGSIARLNELGIDWRVLVLVLSCCTLLVLVFSWAELQSLDLNQLQQALQTSGKGTTRQIRTGVSHSLIGLQLALSLLTLLASSHVMLQALREAWRPTGVETAQLWTLQLNLAALNEGERRDNIYRDVLAHLQQIPGIEAISYSSEARLPTILNYDAVRNAAGDVVGSARIIYQDEQQLAMYQLTLQGRNFSAAELDAMVPEVLINQRLADLLPQPYSEQKLTLPNADLQYAVRGVVSNSWFPGASYLEVPEVYLAARYQQQRQAVLTMRFAEGTEAPTLQAIYQLLHQSDPMLDVLSYSKVSADYAAASQSQRFAAAIAALLALVSLMLVTAGIWGIVSFLVRSRRFELGVHLAMGATPRRLLVSQLRQLAQPVLSSVIFAASLVFFVSGLVRAVPQWAFVLNAGLCLLVILLIVLLAALACWLPLRQVLATDPIEALRSA